MRGNWFKIVGAVGLVLGTVLSASAHADAYDELVSVLKKSPKTGLPVKNMEELMPLLSRDLRANFTFVYKSRSPHGGLGDEAESAVDKMTPRLILFTPDGRLTLAFTGNPEKPGYNTLEAIRFHDKGARFEFSRFVLPDAAAANPRDAELAKENGAPNPSACLRCHGADPRPVSDSYPLWPGFYGSVRDTFPKDSPEGGWYRAFLKKQKNAGLYKYLSWPKGTSVPPYLDPRKFDSNAAEEGVDALKYLPNTRLGMAWTELNRKRIQRKIKASPLYDKYKYGLLAGFLGCHDLPLGQADVDAALKVLTEENTDRLVRLGSRPKGPGAGTLDMQELDSSENLVQVAYLADALGIDRTEWSLAFEKSSYSFFDGILSSIYDGRDYYFKEDFMLEILKDLAVEDPQFRPYYKTDDVYRDYGYVFGNRLNFEAALNACPLLIKKEGGVTLPAPTDATRQAVKAPTVPEVQGRLGLTQLPFQRCTTCHEGKAALSIGRKIPFSSPALLKETLKEKAASGRTLFEDILERVATDGEGQMPPHGARLASEEVKSLRSYLTAAQ